MVAIDLLKEEERPPGERPSSKHILYFE
jgi:hypothetical protein